jgi:hypothetical protein
MFNMSWKITVGNYQLMMIESVEIVSSVEKLSNTATIVLPATAYNKTMDLEQKLTCGKDVTIEIGYDNNPKTEFKGYLRTITTDDGKLKLECEDNIYLYRKSLANTELKNPYVNDVLLHVNKELGGFLLNCDYQYKYDKFVINNNTGYDVLKKIQEETKSNIYLKDNVLHVHSPYKEIFGIANYDFSVNIETEDLKYMKVEDHKVMVTIEYTGKDGKSNKLEHGDTGGERVDIKGATSDRASLLQQATNEHTSRAYTGYDGTFTSWLVPYCEAGYIVTISDKDYPEKNGSYYVTEVKTTFSKSGGVRTIKLAKKITTWAGTLK